jgi:gamma-polyglutamate biosynthesis protein CapA
MSCLNSLRLLGLIGPLLGPAPSYSYSHSYSIPSKQPSTRSSTSTIALHAVGDLLLARGIERKMAQYGEDYPLRAIAPTLKKADIVIGNLECALSMRPFETHQQYRFRAAPDRAKLLKEAGFSVLNLANNHSMDCGSAGLQDTLDALSVKGIGWCGTVGSAGQELLIGRYGDIRVGFLGFCDFPALDAPPSQPAIGYVTGDSLEKAVSAARGHCDLVVLSVHWGNEQSARPTGRQKRLARVAATAGADLILGHHPHVLQGFEVIRTGRRRTLVAYSLGSFLFDGHKEAEKESLILRCALDRSGIRSAQIIPVRIEHSAPRLAVPREALPVLRKLAELSALLGTRLEGRTISLKSHRGRQSAAHE